MRGYGYEPYFVEGDDPETMHQLMAATLDQVIAKIRQIQSDARSKGDETRPRWPMIVLRSPKGWTGPKVVDGKPVEGTFRAHQVPMGEMDRPEHVKILENWMKSYRPDELFDTDGRLREDLREFGASGNATYERQSTYQRRCGAQGSRDARLPRLRRQRNRARSRHGGIHAGSKASSFAMSSA